MTKGCFSFLCELVTRVVKQVLENVFFKAILNGLILYFKYNPNDTLDDKYISKKISLFK